MNAVGFTTTRTKVIDLYKSARLPFEAKTRPYKSTRSFGCVFVHPKDSDGAETDIAFAKFHVQTVDFFSYGRGDRYPDTGLPARSDDTNLANGGRTNGAEDFVIEALSATARSFAIDTGTSVFTGDPEVDNALKGVTSLNDPGCHFTPLELASPLTLEDTIFEALRPHISLQIIFDDEKVIDIGTMDQVGEGAGKSYLRSAGEPSVNSRFRIPEGFLWRRDGQPDCSFVLRAHLASPKVIPVTLAKNALKAGVNRETLRPTAARLDVAMRLHGLSVRLPSHN